MSESTPAPTQCPACGTPIAAAGARFCHGCGRLLDGAAPVPAAGAEAVTIVAPAPAVGPPPVSDRYEIVRFLGEGGTKRVYLARDRRLDRLVAVGVLQQQHLDVVGRARLDREARAMAALGDHPSIVTLYDIEEVGEHVYIVCQYMDGGSLADALHSREGRAYDLPEALGIGVQVAEALAHAHRAGIVHRDVKPGNVWLRSGGSALLGDFGLARFGGQATQITTEGSMLGTAAYMPPEQALGKDPEPASDLYSLGCLLYELVTGHRPFAGDDPVAVISQHLHADPAPPSFHRPELPAALDRLILDLLAKRPEERPPGAAAVAARLRSLVAGDSSGGAAPSAGAAVTSRLFVGRREEMSRLKDVLEDTLRGTSRLCMLVGEPGIGKSRMVEELRALATLRGARVLVGPCFEGEASVPYLPFAEALRQLCRNLGDAELRPVLGSEAPQIARLVSEVRARFPDIADAPRLEGEAERQRLFDAVTTFLRQMAERQALVLVLEDLHWADKPSLLLMRHLARRLTRERVLILGTYRDVDLDRTHPLADALSALKQERPYERILLRGFPREDVAELLKSLAGREPPPGFVEEMWRETEGNPFFLQEILRHLVEVGAIVRKDGQWVGDPATVRRNLPEGVREVIGRRLSHLSAECNEMLSHASLVSSGFSFELLHEIEGGDEDKLLDLLDEALEARILREVGERGVYDFDHALVRQTLSAELSTPRRVRLHRRIGEALERLHASDPDRVLNELAHQFYQAAPAGLEEKAMAYAARAAERAMSSVAYEEAVGHYQRALELLEGDDEEARRRRCRFTLELGDALYLSGELESGGERFLEASRLASGSRYGDLAVEAVDRWQARGFRAGRVNTVQLELVERALELNREGTEALRSRLLATKSQAMLSSSENEDERVELCREAVRLARSSGDPAAMMAATIAVAVAGMRSAFSVDELRSVVERLEPGGPPRLRLWALAQLVRRLYERGRAGEAVPVEDRYHRLAAQLQDPWLLNQGIFLRVLRATLEGRLDQMRSRLVEFLSAAPTHEVDIIESMVTGHMAFMRGRIEDMVAIYESTTGARARLAERSLGSVGFVFSATLARTGRREEAERLLDAAAAHGFDRLPWDVTRQVGLVRLAECAVVLQSGTHAAALYSALEPSVGEAVIGGPILIYDGAVDVQLGGLAALLGEWPRAVEHFERALVTEDGAGARAPAVRARVAYAQALARRGGTTDRARARELLSFASRESEAMGLDGYAATAAALLTELDAGTSD